MSQDMQFGLISQASLITTPQDCLTAVTNDYSSIFGNHSNDYLKEMSIMCADENSQTPFSYDNFNGFSSPQNDDFSNLTFEC